MGVTVCTEIPESEKKVSVFEQVTVSEYVKVSIRTRELKAKAQTAYMCAHVISMHRAVSHE